MKIAIFVLIFIVTSFQLSSQTYIDTFGNTIVHISDVVDSQHFVNTSTSGWSGAWDLHWGVLIINFGFQTIQELKSSILKMAT